MFVMYICTAEAEVHPYKIQRSLFALVSLVLFIHKGNQPRSQDNRQGEAKQDKRHRIDNLVKDSWPMWWQMDMIENIFLWISTFQRWDETQHITTRILSLTIEGSIWSICSRKSHVRQQPAFLHCGSVFPPPTDRQKVLYFYWQLINSRNLLS